jgi:UDP-3-O-[3-hydroxymyristoyl] glucosamine N-acyltransferase
MATLKELAELAGGTVIGDADLKIRKIAPVDRAAEGDLTFIANPKYLPRLRNTRASAAIVEPGVEAPEISLLVCRNPYLAFARIQTFLHARPAPSAGVMEGAYVHPDASLGESVTIHPGCYVGAGVDIGDRTILYPNVVLYEGVKVGRDCILHGGVVVREECQIGNGVILQPCAIVGSDGFGFAPDGPRYVKIPQVGKVIIEDDVEVGAASCIDRATLGVTRIGRGTKIDNLVQVAHNVVIGENTIIVSQVGISGSTEIGNHCTLGGQAGVAGHLKIGDNVMLGAKSGVSNSVTSNQVLSGVPVMPHKDWLKASMSFAKLPEIRKEVQRLRRQLDILEKRIQEK